MKERYIRTYGNSYEVVSSDRNRLMKIFRDTCKENGILYRPDDCFSYLNEYPESFEQMTLF